MKKGIIITAILIIVGGIGMLLVFQKKALPTVTKISATHPFALEIKRERSFFQAQKIQNRLREKGLPTYIIALDDTTQSGQWYSIMAEATADTSILDSISQHLKDQFNLDSLKIVNFLDSTRNFADTDTLKIEEKKRIHKSVPLVPIAARDIIYHFPNTDFFYIKDFKLVNFVGDSIIENQLYTKLVSNIDLPRGISITMFQNIANAWAEAIYTDNLYGDEVTIDILHLKPTMAFLPDSVQSDTDSLQFHIAEFFGQKILDTDNYSTEQKFKLAIRPGDPLRGYRIVIKPQKSNLRTYIILVDNSTKFVYFCQSSKKSPEELLSIMELVNKGEGIDEFDEFHNAYFTMPCVLPTSDVFISFGLEKLDWSYAKSKGYRPWSKQMVGHWSANAYFINPVDKRLWSFSLFDLLTPEKLQLIYHNCYVSERSKDEATDVYGTTGYYVNEYEVNFPFDRYIGSVDDQNSIKLNYESAIKLARQLIESGEYDFWTVNQLLNEPSQFYKMFASRMGFKEKPFSLDELKDRGNRLQFLAGGYSATVATTLVDTTNGSPKPSTL